MVKYLIAIVMIITCVGTAQAGRRSCAGCQGGQCQMSQMQANAVSNCVNGICNVPQHKVETKPDNTLRYALLSHYVNPEQFVAARAVTINGFVATSVNLTLKRGDVIKVYFRNIPPREWVFIDSIDGKVDSIDGKVETTGNDKPTAKPVKVKCVNPICNCAATGVCICEPGSCDCEYEHQPLRVIKSASNDSDAPQFE